jgi:RimJ/RimL family protein N-acetyltransferase
MAVLLRELKPQDWIALRRIRLHALRTEPGLFFKSYEEEAGLTDAEWIARASGDETHQLFGLFDGDELIGISGVVADPGDPTGGTAGFGMSYILPEYRGRGLAARFYEARLAWAVARPQFVRAAVGHRRSNEASRRTLTRFGFRWSHDEPHHWPDGETEDDVCYELPLREPITSHTEERRLTLP